MSVFLADEQDDPVSTDQLRRVAEATLRAEAVPGDAEVAVVLVDREQMAAYNARFLDRAGPTDVLAFPLDDHVPGRPPPPGGDGPPPHLGDVFVCPSYVREQAAGRGVAFEVEMALMVVHGILHLLGYDHAEDAGAAVMEDRERAVLAHFGWDRP